MTDAQNVQNLSLKEGLEKKQFNWRTNKHLGAVFKWMMIILGPLDHVIDDNDVLFVVVDLT